MSTLSGSQYGFGLNRVGQNWVSRHVPTTRFQLVIDLSTTCKPRFWAKNAI